MIDINGKKNNLETNMDKYRKLTKEEVEAYGIKTKQNNMYKDFINIVIKHFGTNAYRVLIGFNSEYNDMNYDIHGFSYIEVYDKDGNWLVPKKDMIKEWRRVLSNDEYIYKLCNNKTSSNDPPDDLIIFIGESIPDLYVKE